jgi:hypothetical protein
MSTRSSGPPGCYADGMARTTAAAAKIQARALRVLADEVEAVRKRLSPELSRVRAGQIEVPGLDDLSARAWDEAWGAEIDRRVAKASNEKRHDLGAVLERLRARR